MSESWRYIFEIEVTTHGEPLNIVETQVTPQMLLVSPISTSKPSIRSNCDCTTGLPKQSVTPLVLEGSLQYSIARIRKQPLFLCGWTTGSSYTEPTKDAEQQSE